MEIYDEMIVWVGDNLEDSQIDDFNIVLEIGNIVVIKLVVKSLLEKYVEVNGIELGCQLGGKVVQGGFVYESMVDLMKDMQNFEYVNNFMFCVKVEVKFLWLSIL